MGTSRLTLDLPRDREGRFAPKLIAKYQRRFPDFNAKIISMYARGMTVREIRGHLEELYSVDVSPDLISTVPDAVLETVAEWQGRPLDVCYPLVFFDAIRVKIRDEGFVRNKAVYIALDIFPDGTKEILGIWIEQTEGAKFWLGVMNELKNRGVADILIAVVDGLKGFSEATNAVFPKTVVQTCIVHLIRNSMSFAAWKDRKSNAHALCSVYRKDNAEAGHAALEAFEEGPWARQYPAIALSWRRHWEHVTLLCSHAFSLSARQYAGSSIPTEEMDKTEPRKLCYESCAWATPWRRTEPWLQVPSGRLFIILPTWSVRVPSSACSPTGRQIVHRRVRPAGRSPIPGCAAP